MSGLDDFFSNLANSLNLPADIARWTRNAIIGLLLILGLMLAFEIAIYARLRR